MADDAKPLPVRDLDSLPFWEGCARHELRAQRCLDCGWFRWPPRPLCSRCHSWNAEWVTLPGTGTVLSFVEVHHATSLAFTDDVPYAIVEVALDGSDDQVRLTSNLVDHDQEHLRVGLPVQVAFDEVTADVTLPRFRPA